MNKNLKRLLCLCLTVMMTLSSVAFAQELDTTVIDEISDELISEEVPENQEVYLHSEPLKAVYLEYLIGGEDMSDDTSVGDITYASKISNILYQVTPSAANQNCSWQADGQIADWGGKRMQVDGEWCVMTTKYFRIDRPNSPIGHGNMPFALGSSFTTDYNQAVFEVDYYDNSTNGFSVVYMNSADAKTTSAVNFARTGTNTWMTASGLTGTDAHLYRNKNTGLGDGNTSPVRINSNGEIYIKGFRVYTPGYRELAAAAEEVSLNVGEEFIEENFPLPSSDSADSVVWTSSDEDVIEIADGTAYVIRSDYDNRECTLTARVVKDGYYIEKEYNVTVKALYQDLNVAKENLEITSTDISNVTESFELPTVDDRFTLVWSSSDESLVTVDGNTAVVNANPFEDNTCALTAKIYMGDRYVEKVFELSLPAQYKKATFVEYEMGEGLTSDIASGGLKYDITSGDLVLTRVEPSSDTSNLPLVALGITHDWATMREQYAGRWAAVTGKYSRPARTDRPVVDGNLPFDTGSAFSEESNLTIEVDYFDNVEGSFKLNYKSSADSGTRVDIPREGSQTWKTYAVTVDNAYFVPGKTGMGAGNQSDFRFESTNGNDIMVGAVRVYSPGYDKIADAVDALEFDSELTGITESFALPEIDGVEIYWISSDESIVKIVDGMAMIFGDEGEEKNCTITAKIASKGVYAEKSFDVNLAKKPKRAVVISNPTITVNGTLNTVAFELANTSDMYGTNISLILTAVDKNTDEIISRKVVSEKILKDTAEISASVNVSAGQELKYYLVNSNGASMYNLAPMAIENYAAVSKISSVKFVWDHASDDYFIKEYVVYDEAGNEYLRTEENSFSIGDVGEGEEYSFCVEGFDHEGNSTGKTDVATGSLFIASSCDLSAPMTNSSNKNEVYFCAASKDITGGDNYSVEVTKVDAVTGEERVGRSAVNRSSIGKWNTNLYFRADRDNVTEDVREVTIIIDYYDEGTANVNLQYNAEDGSASKSIVAFKTTGTNTWKTAVVHITDAKFVAPSSLTNCDFRINGGHNSEICLSKVTVLPTENY